MDIAPYVKILSSVHREELNKPILWCDLDFKKVTIEDGSDIGIGVIILHGVRIGKGAVIGAGAVVTYDIPYYDVWAGVPTQKIRVR